jgi:hypothetical protein
VEARHMSLEEFKKERAPHGTDQLLKVFNGGTFFECHQAIFAATGIWVDDLVPVFQKLDAFLITRNLAPR